MSNIAGDLGGQIVSLDINPDATTRLAAIYHRSIAHCLWESADVAATQGREDGWKDVVWLPPRSVWAERKGLSQAERRAAVTPEVIADLVHPTPQPPAVSPCATGHQRGVIVGKQKNAGVRHRGLGTTY